MIDTTEQRGATERRRGVLRLGGADHSLTRMERESLRAYARQGSVRMAADSLYLSPDTVSGHLESAYRKLGVRRAIQAFRVLGWLVIPEGEG